MIGLQSDFCDIFGAKQFIEKSEWKKVAVDWPKDRMTHSTNDSFLSENMKIIFYGFVLEILDSGETGMMYVHAEHIVPKLAFPGYRVSRKIPASAS